MARQPDEQEIEGEDVARVSLLFERQLLEGIDRASGRFGITRSAFIRQACLKALKEVQGEPDWDDLLESTKTPFYYDLTGVARRLQYVGYVSPKGLRTLRQRISDKVGPAEIIQSLPSPFEQLLRKLGLPRKRVEEAIAKGETLALKVGAE